MARGCSWTIVGQDFAQLAPANGLRPVSRDVDDRAHAEEVAAMIDGLADSLFGAHVARGPEHLPLLGLLLGCRRSQTVGGFLQHPFGETEVEHLDLAALVQADVGGLDVAMDDPRLWAASSASATWIAISTAWAISSGPCFTSVTQRLAFHELHGDEGQPILRLAYVVDDADMRDD